MAIPMSAQVQQARQGQPITDPNDPNYDPTLDPSSPYFTGGAQAQGGQGQAQAPQAPPVIPTPSAPSILANSDNGEQNHVARNTIASNQQLTQGGVDAASVAENYALNNASKNISNAGAIYDPTYADPNSAGFTPDQQQQILGENTGIPGANLQDLAFGADAQSKYQLDPATQQAMQGNPYLPYQGAQPGINGVLQSAINSGNQIGDIQHHGNDLAQSEINPAALGVSNSYTAGMQGSLAGGYKAQQAALANPGLNVTDQYKQQAGMTDEEVAQTAALGAETAGAGYESDIDQLKQNAIASGTTNPLAVAAEEQQLRGQQGAAVTDATVQAQLAARAQQRAAAQGVQSTELGAGQFQTGAALTAAQAQEQAGISATQQQEATRLGAEQSLEGLQVGTTLAEQNAQTGAAQGSATNLAQAGEYGTSLDASTLAAGENAGATRAATIGTTNLNAGIQGQQQGYNQNLGLNTTLSNRYAGIAQQQQGVVQNAGQAALQGQAINTSAATAAGGQLQQADATAANTALQGSADYNASKNVQSANSFGSKLSGAVAGAIGSWISRPGSGAASKFAEGGFVDHPTTFHTASGEEGLMGEAGPEAIVPLNNPEPMINQIRHYQRMHVGQNHHDYTDEDYGLRHYADGGMLPAPVTNMQRAGGAPAPTMAGGYGSSQPPMDSATAMANIMGSRPSGNAYGATATPTPAPAQPASGMPPGGWTPAQTQAYNASPYANIVMNSSSSTGGVNSPEALAARQGQAGAVQQQAMNQRLSGAPSPTPTPTGGPSYASYAGGNMQPVNGSMIAGLNAGSSPTSNQTQAAPTMPQGYNAYQQQRNQLAGTAQQQPQAQPMSGQVMNRMRRGPMQAQPQSQPQPNTMGGRFQSNMGQGMYRPGRMRPQTESGSMTSPAYA